MINRRQFIKASALANISYRVGRRIRWDDAQETIADDPAATRLLVWCPRNNYTFAAMDFSLSRGASDAHTLPGSVRSEPRRRSGKDRPPKGLRRFWVLAWLRFGHRSMGTCSLRAPSQNPNAAQQMYRYFGDTTLVLEMLMLSLRMNTLFVADRNFGVYSVVRAAVAAHAHALVRLTQARAQKLAREAQVKLQNGLDQPVQWTPPATTNARRN